jgi:hypothetical protein
MVLVYSVSTTTSAAQIHLMQNLPPPLPARLFVRKPYQDLAIKLEIDRSSEFGVAPLAVRPFEASNPRLRAVFDSKMRRYAILEMIFAANILTVFGYAILILAIGALLFTVTLVPAVFYILLQMSCPPGVSVSAVIAGCAVAVLIASGSLKFLARLDPAGDFIDKFFLYYVKMLEKYFGFSEATSVLIYSCVIVPLLLIFAVPFFLLTCFLRETWLSLLPLSLAQLSAGMAFLFVLLMMALRFASSLQAKMESHMTMREPVTYLAIRLYRLIRKLEKDPSQWTIPQFKNEVATDLERIAAIFDFALPHRLRAADLDTNMWLKNNLAGIALALRMKKKLVFNPDAGSYKRLTGSLSRTLYHVVEGNWAWLETESLSKMTLREGSWLWFKRLLAILKGLLVAAAPLGLLYLTQRIPELKFDPQYFAWINIVCIGWLAVSLLLMIDPLFSSKLSAIKAIRGLGLLSSEGSGNPGRSEGPG